MKFYIYDVKTKIIFGANEFFGAKFLRLVT